MIKKRNLLGVQSLSGAASLVLVGLLGLSSCVVRHGDFTVLSNKLVRLSDFELDKAERERDVIGTDTQHIIIFIPTQSQALLEEAIDDALDKGNGDVLTDAVVEFESWYIPYIYGKTQWRVTGDVVRTRRY